MDDNRTFVEFPIGDTGQYIKVKEPTDAQRLVLALSRAPRDGDTRGSLDLARRILRVLEILSGDQWFTVIEEGLLTEQFTVPDVLGVVEQVAAFNWADTHKDSSPLPEDGSLPGEHYVADQIVTPQPAPRVVGA